MSNREDPLERTRIENAVRGDREAFRVLVLDHQSEIRSHLRRLTGFDNARADDLAQEVFIQVFAKLSSFRFQSSFRSWLYRLATNAFLDDLRKRKSRTTATETEMEADEGTYEGDAERKMDLRSALDRALAALRAEQRTAILLTALEEFTSDEAAEIMKIPIGTLKSHVLRGKIEMQSVLSRYGFEVAL